MTKLDPCFAGMEGASAVEEQLATLGLEFPVFDELREWIKDAPYKTLPQLFIYAHSLSKNKNFLGKRVDGRFEFETYDQVYKKIQSFASALISLGLNPGDRVANFSNNRPEWPVVDYGCSFAACVHVPMYATLSKSEVEYILRDCEAKCVVVANPDQLRKVLDIEANCPALEHIIAITPTEDNSSKNLWSWSEFLEYGRVRLSNNANRIAYLQTKLSPYDVASLVYTSGTTGNPKGVMLMHANLCSQGYFVGRHLKVTADDLELCFLPLSHVFERMINYMITAAGGTIGYAQGIHTVMQDMVDLQPTLFASVPLLFHKMYDRVMDNPNLKRAPSLKWAIHVGRSYTAAKRAGKVSKILQAQQAMARGVLRKNMLKRFGGRMRVMISGGAPLRVDVAQFFREFKLPLIEGYGLTETSPVLAINVIGDNHPGSVGVTLEGVKLKIDDGELVARGPNIMRGYFKQPEATMAAFDKDGWFHTGDVAVIEDDYVRITDRKKNLIVLANGKNVAPAGIEHLICKSPWIARALLVGDNAQYVGALIVPDFERLKTYAEEHKLEGTVADFVKDPEYRSLIHSEVREACKELSNYEKVKRVEILSRDFSEEAGELTSSLKVKRRAVENNFADVIVTLLSLDK